MNVAYFKFLFVNLSRKKSIWITFSLFLFTITSFLIIIPAVGNISPLQAWAQPTMVVCQTFVGMIGAIFCAILAVNIFKDPLEDGSDLIIVSKSIKKINIIFSKIFVFLIYCLIANCAAIFISIFTIFLPKTEVEFYWKLLLSLFIGNCTSFAIFGSIAILLSVKLSKLGMIITNLCISLAFLVYQIIGLFVLPTPTKTMIDNKVGVNSYIMINRDTNTGKYTEDNVVNFSISDLTQGNIKKDFSNWKGVEQFWKDVNAATPTTILNTTDLASQISYSYLSAGLQDYSDRQAKRFFSSSTRAYDYSLTSPASPEIVAGVENKKSMPILYIDEQQVEAIPNVWFPHNYAIIGIPSNSFIGLKGFSNKIPVATIKTKEFNSDKEIYLEAEQWIKYSPAFDLMLKHCFDSNLSIPNRSNYYSINSDQIEHPEHLYRTFYNTNDDTAKMFEIIWACLMGKSSEEKYFGKEIMISEDGKTKYDKKYFDINSVYDLNERFFQFKHYCAVKSQEIQNQIIQSGELSTEYETNAYQQALTEYEELSPSLHIKFDKWLMKSIDSQSILIEPNTQTVSFQLLNKSWSNQMNLMSTAGLTKTDNEWIQNAKSSALFKILKLGEIVDEFCMVKEKYCFISLETPERTSDITGQVYINKYTWTPYAVSKVIPSGQNLQWFFYSINRKYDYWWFTLFWLSISIILTSTAIIIYNKYDIK